MKRQRIVIVDHGDGTWSGLDSSLIIEKLTIYKDSCFTISGYHDVKQYELVELLFCNYAIDDIVARRVFDHCVFSFQDFTRRQIDDVMCMLQVRKKPSEVRYSFIACKVLSDGVELKDYVLRRDDNTTSILKDMPEDARMAATLNNIEIAYNLKEMTFSCALQRPTFGQEHHDRMVIRREMHKTLAKCRHDARVIKRAKTVPECVSEKK